MHELDNTTFARQPNFSVLKLAVEEYKYCNECAFAPYRESMVWGKGRLDSGILIIGEAPTKDDESTVLPLSGKPGKLLDKALASCGLSYRGNKANCYVTNALRCRPCDATLAPTRKPSGDEIANCRPTLRSLLKASRPTLVILLGNVAKEAVFGSTCLPTQTKKYGVEFLKIFHPAAVKHDESRLDFWNTFWYSVEKKVKRFRRVVPSDNRWNIPFQRVN